MLRIDLEIMFVSPSLQVFHGKIIIRNDKTFDEVFSCNVERKFSNSENTTGYDNFKGDHTLYHKLKPVFSLILHAYGDGVKLNKRSYAWISKENELTNDSLVPVTSQILINPDNYYLAK